MTRSDAAGLEHLSDRLWLDLPLHHAPALRAALSRIPSAEVARRPRLLIPAYQERQFRRAAIDPALRGMAQFYATHGSAVRRRPSSSSLRADAQANAMIALVGARRRGEYDHAEEIGQYLQETITREIDGAEGSSWLVTARPGWLDVERAVTAMLDGRFTDAWALARGAYDQAFPSPAHRYVGRLAAGCAALLCAFAGSRDLTSRWLRACDEAGQPPAPVRAVVELPALLARAVQGIDALDRPRAREALEQVGDPTAGYELWPYIAMVWSRYDQIFGTPAAGLARLDEIGFGNASPTAPPDVAAGLLLRARADLLLEAGEGDAVIAMHRAHPSVPMLRIPAARAHLRAGDLNRAIRLASVPGRRAGTTRRDAMDLLLIASAAQLRRGRPDDAVQLFREALEFFSFTGNLSSFREMSTEDRRALAELAGIADPMPSGTGARPSPVHGRLAGLTRREDVVLNALATGKTAEDIAESLSVSVHTVRSQARALYRKLGVSSRAEALAVATRRGIIGRAPGPGSHDVGPEERPSSPR